MELHFLLKLKQMLVATMLKIIPSVPTYESMFDYRVF